MIGPKSDWHLGNYTRNLWRNIDDPIPGFDAKHHWGGQEWLEFAQLVGIYHVMLYDNSAANAVNTSLAPYLKPFGDFVTRVEWPHVVCNNVNPGDEKCGERSSQYAAENSCRVRYGPETDWIANFYLDEYLVPMGNVQPFHHYLQLLDWSRWSTCCFDSPSHW